MLTARTFRNDAFAFGSARHRNRRRQFCRTVNDRLSRLKIFGCTNLWAVLFALDDIASRINRMLVCTASADDAHTIFAETVGVFLRTIRTIDAALRIRAYARNLVTFERYRTLLIRTCCRDALAIFADFFALTGVIACAAVANGIERDAFRRSLCAAIRIACIALEVASGDILKVEFAAFGVCILKGIIVAIVAATAAESRIEKRNAFFLILISRANLLIIGTSRELTFISIRRKQLTAIAIFACIGLAGHAIFHHMNVTGSIIPRIIATKSAIKRAPDFSFAACTFAIFTERKSRLAILAFVIVTREIRTGACASGTAIRAARFRGHAFAIAKDIALRTATIIVILIPVIQAFGAAIDHRAIGSRVIARLCAASVYIGRVETNEALTGL